MPRSFEPCPPRSRRVRPRTARHRSRTLARKTLGAVVLLAGWVDDNVELLRQAANEIAAEWTDREAARLLLDAATLAEIGA
jgi:hypothetical protein